MKTLNLKEAAIFLNMTPEGVRVKAARGEIPGAKPGKCWCFLENDLVEYLRSLYPYPAETLQGVIDMERRKSWRSTKEIISGGLPSAIKEREYRKVLELQTV